MQDKEPVTRNLTVNRYHFALEVAATRAKQKKGLGGRTSMPTSSGMAFIFPDSALRRVWMKGMHFAIDIIWLDPDKRVLHIEADISPDTYPKIFDPGQPCQYIIELNSGQAARSGICVGKVLSF